MAKRPYNLRKKWEKILKENPGEYGNLATIDYKRTIARRITSDVSSHLDQAKDFAKTYKFKNKKDKKIWLLFCQGMSKHKIADKLKFSYGRKFAIVLGQ